MVPVDSPIGHALPVIVDMLLDTARSSCFNLCAYCNWLTQVEGRCRYASFAKNPAEALASPT